MCIRDRLRGVELKMNVDFFADKTYWEEIADRIVFTGKIDEFYDYKFGKLEYRTVRFEEELSLIHIFLCSNTGSSCRGRVTYTQYI